MVERAEMELRIKDELKQNTIEAKQEWIRINHQNSLLEGKQQILQQDKVSLFLEKEAFGKEKASFETSKTKH